MFKTDHIQHGIIDCKDKIDNQVSLLAISRGKSSYGFLQSVDARINGCVRRLTLHDMEWMVFCNRITSVRGSHPGGNKRARFQGKRKCPARWHVGNSIQVYLSHSQVK
jgi:hypothetical protein